ncbi:MAG: hypothetical protein H6713_31335 [Myxococcales bacterium]|nr:hypothetical protein [Myxococcales bacterium]MCB9754454.1 hypothetical protein [Myxococcales bacterium]
MSIPTTNKPVHTYRVYMRTAAGAQHQEVQVILYEKLSTGQVKSVGTLLFTDAESPVAELRNNAITLVYPRAAYQDAIDLLRNEEPITLRTHAQSESGWLQSGLETVGEDDT